MSNPRRVLLTGASGFIGRHVVPLLKSREFEVHAISRSRADLLIPGVAAALVESIRPTHLLHLAWNAEPGRFWTAPDNLDWVAASLGLHRSFAALGGGRAVFAGSCAEYDWTHSLLDEAATPCAPATLYGIAKDRSGAYCMPPLRMSAWPGDGCSSSMARRSPYPAGP